MKDKEKTETILNALKKNFTSWGKARTNIIFPELRLGSGYCGVAQRRMDFFVISSNAGNETIGFEIKASKQDFKKDVNDDMKQRGARLYCNLFYYVVPKGLVKPEEVPLWAGLWELDFDEPYKIEQGIFHEVVPAPLMPKAVPSWGLICSMIRHVNKEVNIDYTEMDNLKTNLSKAREENRRMRDLLKRISSIWKEEYDNNEFISWRLQEYK